MFLCFGMFRSIHPLQTPSEAVLAAVVWGSKSSPNVTFQKIYGAPEIMMWRNDLEALGIQVTERQTLQVSRIMEVTEHCRADGHFLQNEAEVLLHGMEKKNSFDVKAIEGPVAISMINGQLPQISNQQATIATVAAKQAKKCGVSRESMRSNNLLL